MITKKLFFAALTFILTSCDVPYPDILALSPQVALSNLASLESDLNRDEADLQRDFGPGAPAAPAGEFIAAGEQIAGVFAQDSLNTIAEYRRRIAQDRERIYQANPSLRPVTAPTGRSVPVTAPSGSSVIVGASGNIQTSGLCGLPRNQVSDANRRSLHAEASKSSSFSFPFQTTSQIVAEYNRNGAQGCSAIGQQFQAFMNGFRNAMSAADTINNGPSRGVQCDPNIASASSSSYCSATVLLYQAQTVSALCHAVCN